MHQITGYFFTNKKDKRFVIYSTLYKAGRFASMHDCTGLTDEQAKGKFLIEHSNEVDELIKQKRVNDKNTKLILS